ncbi:MAG TPA: methyltransferase domain-containing protein [Syntrophorhabdaceae bacterium]|nr:methyltransferase domain-containing protein [Syntrophorhabdaceae bacterium]
MNESRKPHGAGRSTYELIDTERFFEILNVEKSMVLLDIGAGSGDYTIPLAEAIGPGGHIYALDAWEEGLARVRARASEKHLNNVSTLEADANEHIPVADGTVDICLIANVLHDLLREATGETVIREMLRVLKPGGRLALLEFKKIGDGPGPPLHIRLSEEDVRNLLVPFGFHIGSVSDVGKYHYLLIAEKQFERLKV